MSITVTYPAQVQTLSWSGYNTDVYGNTIPFTYTLVNRQIRPSRSGWREKSRYVFLVANGYLPQFSYTADSYEETVMFSLGSVHASGARPWFDPIRCDAGGGYPGYLGTVALANAKSANANKLAAMLNGQVRNQYYSVFETLYEGKKTKKMILEAVLTTVQAARQVRKGQFAKAANTLGLKKPPKGAHAKRGFANNWLEYRYGWGPLYYTVYGAMQQAYDLMRNQEPVRTVRVKTSTVLPANNSGDTTGIVNGYNSMSLGSTFTMKDRQEATVYTVRKAYYRVHNPGLANATSMGLTNPLLVAWELVPLSFVADWFVNVSDTLEQFDAWVGKTYLTGTLTHTTVGERYRWPVKTSGSGGFKKQGYYRGKFHSTARTIVSSPPTVMPCFDVSVSPKRLIDGIALLKQLFKR